MNLKPAIPSILATAALVAAAPSVNAATFSLLTDPSLVGRLPGADGYWGSLDDVVFGGLNPFGSGVAFVDDAGNYGTVTGEFESNDGGPGVFGVNTLDGGPFATETSNNGVPFFNFATQATFDDSLANTFTASADRTSTATYHMVDSLGQKFTYTGSYVWLLPSDDPAAYIGDPELLAHVEFLLPLLPTGWTTFTTGLETYVITAGSFSGTQGALTKAFYSLDPSAAPVPVPAALPFLVSGLASLGVWQRRRAARST